MRLAAQTVEKEPVPNFAPSVYSLNKLLLHGAPILKQVPYIQLFAIEALLLRACGWAGSHRERADADDRHEIDHHSDEVGRQVERHAKDLCEAPRGV